MEFKKNDDVCFLDRDKLILASFSHYSKLGNIVVNLKRNGFLIKKTIPLEILRPVDFQTCLSLVDLRPPTVKADHLPGEVIRE